MGQSTAVRTDGVKVRARTFGAASRCLGGGTLLAVVVLSFAAVPSSALSVPSVTTPSVTVSSVTTPVVTTPSVTIPSISTPSVPVPPLPTTPSLPVPPLPVSTPSASTPSLTSGSSSSGSSVFNDTGGTASDGTAAPPYAPSAANGAQAGSPSEQAAQFAARASQSARPRRGPALQRYIRKEVLRLGSCLSSLTPSQDRLLVVAAGIGIGHPNSAASVARVLHIRRAAVTRLENAAVGRLEANAYDGRCSRTPNAVPWSALLITPGITTVPSAINTELTQAFQRTPTGGSAQQRSRSARSDSTRARRARSAKEKSVAESALPLPSHSGPLFDAWVYVLLGLLVLGALLITGRLRYGRTIGALTGAAPGPGAAGTAPAISRSEPVMQPSPPPTAEKSPSPPAPPAPPAAPAPAPATPTTAAPVSAAAPAHPAHQAPPASVPSPTKRFRIRPAQAGTAFAAAIAAGAVRVLARRRRRRRSQ